MTGGGNSVLPGWYCADCGGTEIHHDAVAQWNPEKEDFDVIAVLDDHWCSDCMERDINDRGEPTWGVPSGE